MSKIPRITQVLISKFWKLDNQFFDRPSKFNFRICCFDLSEFECRWSLIINHPWRYLVYFGLLLADSFENIFVFRKSKTSSSLILKFSLNGQMNFGSDEFWRFSRLENILIIFTNLVSLWQFLNFANFKKIHVGLSGNGGHFWCLTCI